jgi:hypothetical protein
VKLPLASVRVGSIPGVDRIGRQAAQLRSDTVLESSPQTRHSRVAAKSPCTGAAAVSRLTFCASLPEANRGDGRLCIARWVGYTAKYIA